MVTFHSNILCLLHIVNALENAKSVSNTGDAHALQIIVVERHQSLSNNLVLCNRIITC